MQERRSAIRVAHTCRSQYCASDDLLPKDGRIVNLSVRGAGLLAREQHRVGGQMTASFSLPGVDDPMTVTGMVRWSSPSRQGRWCSIGMEWLPMEETTRNRLRTFLDRHAKSIPSHPTVPSQPAWQRSIPSMQMIPLVWLILGGIVTVFLAVWVQALQQRASIMEGEMSHRDAVITTLRRRERQLAQREASLKQELGTSRAHLATASEEVARLDEQAQQLAGDAQRLSQEVGLFQQSYTKVRKEREQLIRQVMDLEQERMQLTQRLSSLPELQMAVREAIEARKQAQTEAKRIRIQILRSEDSKIRPGDNQGYLIRDGHSTAGKSTMWIRVHDPQVSTSQ